jgi:DNA invertase Pin-like site-specific DNA recombinase
VELNASGSRAELDQAEAERRGVVRDRMTAAAAYVRVSSRAQDHATQRSAIARAARARGHQITRWFHEKMTATRLARPVLQELRAAVRAGEVTVLYVFRLDRLTRTGIRDTLAVLDELRGAGCKVITLADGFDLEGPAADVVVAVLAWAAQMERQALGERISAARARLASEGRAWGRPRRAGPELVARVRELASQGRSMRAIAVALKLPRATVGKIVARKRPYE